MAAYILHDSCIVLHHATLWLETSALYMRTKFEVSSFSRYWDIQEPKNVKIGYVTPAASLHVTPATSPADQIFIFLVRAPGGLQAYKIWRL